MRLSIISHWASKGYRFVKEEENISFYYGVGGGYGVGCVHAEHKGICEACKAKAVVRINKEGFI